MFGYVIPDKMNMFVKDFVLFRAYYCGICKALSKGGGTLSRFCTNYDTAFLNALVHSLNKTEVKIKPQTCILSPLKKKAMLEVDELTKRVADVSVLLVYNNLKDDVVDGKKLRALPKAALSIRAKRAKRKEPQIAKCIEESYQKLRVLEKDNCSSPDEACEPFAKLLEEVTAVLSPTISDKARRFAYNLGKLVYLMDALDDVEKDNKKKCYNPLTAAFGECQEKTEFIEKNKEALRFLFDMCYNQIVDDYNNMDIEVSEGVLSNTVYLGLKMQIDKLFKGENKCAVTRL